MSLPPTTIWGHNGMWPGPTIEARRNRAIKVHWINNLPTTPLPQLSSRQPAVAAIGVTTGRQAT
ncbi:MAG TPA: multicopper oxidase domain-containing protein [Symbiobacteriaceae bacterium]